MLIIQSTNIDKVVYKNSKYKAVYVGNYEIWSKIAINFNNFLKYNYENFDFKFLDVITANESALYDQMYSFDTNIEIIDTEMVYNYNIIKQFNVENSIDTFKQTIIISEFDQLLNHLSTDFIDNSINGSIDASYDQMYSFDMNIEILDTETVYNYDIIKQFNTDNSDNEFIDFTITGESDQLLSTEFIGHADSFAESALYDQMYSFDTNIEIIDTEMVYNYNIIKQFNVENSIDTFKQTIIISEFDQLLNHLSTDFIDNSINGSIDASYDQMYSFDMNIEILDTETVYNYDIIKQFNTDNSDNEFEGEVLIYDQLFVYTVNNITEHFN